MANFTILGAGLVGSTMAVDLAFDRAHSIRLCDRDQAAVDRVARRVKALTGETIEGHACDLMNESALRDVTGDADVVLGALSSAIGYRVLERIMALGKPYVDISFMPEDAIDLNDRAEQAGVLAVVDCGVAPGMSNLWAGLAALRLNPCERLTIMVGGVPRDRRWPWEYKAGFSPGDVIEEYTRPARIVENGRVVIREALSEVERVDLPGVGTLEAFITDGLRSIATTLKIPNMVEKTMRYPGHAERMAMLRHLGMFSTDEIELNGVRVRPRDLTAKLLFPQWSYDDEEVDLTVMRVEAIGRDQQGAPARLRFDLFDERDAETGCTSMSRTTAFPATLVARRIADGDLKEMGVRPLELLAGDTGLVTALHDGLTERGVRLNESLEPLEG